MNQRKIQRLKPLLDKVPPGFLVDAAWLRKRNGINPKSIHDYAQRGWLERVIHGVYRRPYPERVRIPAGADWQIALLSLQWIMDMKVHLGGESALNLAGFAHYLPLGANPQVHVYGDVPSWIKRLPVNAQFVIHSRSLFGNSSEGIMGDSGRMRSSMQTVDIWRWPLIISSPERAILEALNEISTSNASFDDLSKIFENLTSLRSYKLVPLLNACRSVKVRRLFFVLADYHQHAWRKHLDESAIDFGSGPRALTKGGKLHPVYQIYVPADFIPASQAEDYDELPD